MSNDSGLNTDEVKEALAAAGSEEDKRYLERVLADRGVRKAVVSSHEIVAGNPEAYPAETVKQQEDLAIGRPHGAVNPDDTTIRGNEKVAADGDTAAPKGAKPVTAK